MSAFLIHVPHVYWLTSSHALMYSSIRPLSFFELRNAPAVRKQEDVFSTYESSIISLPTPPPEPEPLFEWYDKPEVKDCLAAFNTHLSKVWKSRHGMA